MSYEVHDLGDDNYLVGNGIAVQNSLSNDAKDLKVKLQDALQDSAIRLVGPVSFQQAKTFDTIQIDPKGSAKLEVKVEQTEIGAVLLFCDEDNILQWIFPTGFVAGEANIAGQDRGHLLFDLPAPKDSVGTWNAEKDSRFFVALVFPNRLVATKPLAFFRGVENSLRPYQLVDFPFNDPSRSFARTTFHPGRWLLFIHGAFSSCSGAFSDLTFETIAKLKKPYQGVIGFNHPTLGDSPAENGERLFRDLTEAKGRNPWKGYTFDIVTHSRGGLVCREFASNEGIDVRKVVLVASPNLGTQLAEPKQIRNFLNAYLNLIKFLDRSRSLSVMIRMIELLHYLTVESLSGLQAMRPGSKYLDELNGRGMKSTIFYGISADFKPNEGDKKLVALERQLRENVFEQTNDLIVPHTGSFQRRSGDMSWIPAKNRLELKGNVHHTSYFEQEEVNRKLIEWLTK